MQFPENINIKPSSILKIAGVALVAIIVITLGFRLIGGSFSKTMVGNSISQSAPAFDSNESYGEMAAYDKMGISPSLSVRNVPSPSMVPNDGGVTAGNNAEEFEVTEYSANIETRHLEDTCDEITKLKSREDVIFENANESERYCNYRFKVERDSVTEILGIINGLDPKDVDENTYTIKRQIDDFTSEVEILQKKMNSIEATLNSAISAYDDITKLATKTQDVESLAKIINSKITIIERLTQERLNVSAQLERLERSKATQLDRLDYTYFNVRVSENKFINGQDLKDSWKAAIKSFVRDINEIVQDISINLVTLLFLILQYVIYFFIILVIAKYGWQLTKRIWNK